MANKPLTNIPAKLADAFDTYFQTSRFCQANFRPFNKDMVLGQLRDTAAKFNYTLDLGNTANGFKGVFKLYRDSKAGKRELRVSAKTVPQAEVWG